MYSQKSFKSITENNLINKYQKSIKKNVFGKHRVLAVDFWVTFMPVQIRWESFKQRQEKNKS